MNLEPFLHKYPEKLRLVLCGFHFFGPRCTTAALPYLSAIDCRHPALEAKEKLCQLVEGENSATHHPKPTSWSGSLVRTIANGQCWSRKRNPRIAAQKPAPAK